MADPTEGEIRLQADYAVLALEELRELAEDDATNILGIEDQLNAALIGDYAPFVLSGFLAFRNAVSAALSRSTVRAMLDPHLFNYGKLIASPHSDSQSIFRDLYRYFVDNALDVLERGFTFGAPAFGGTGTGALNRLNEDKEGFDLDESTADAKVVRCYQDEHSGTVEHREAFQIRGSERTRDYLTLNGGSGEPTQVPIGELRGLTGADSQAFLTNPSFHVTNLTFTAGVAAPAAVTDITGWTLDAIATASLDRLVYYRDSMREANPTSLRFLTNGYIEQNLNVRGGNVPTSGIGGLGQYYTPMYVQVAYNASAYAGDGNLTLTFGGVTATVAAVEGRPAGWNILQIALDEDCYYENWNVEDPAVRITLAANTTGDVLVDDVIVAPFTWFDGGWYALVGGATPFLVDDEFTFTDTVTETGILQKWFVRGGYGYLPSTAAGPDWPDPPPTPTPSPTPSPTPTATPTPTPRTPTPTPT